MEKNLWKFIDEKGTFGSKFAHQIKTLYFPLCNTYPIMGSVSPDLHGDLKTDFNSFLLEPVSRLDLINLKSSRNFWIYINPASTRRDEVNSQKIWSLTGVSKDTSLIKKDEFILEAGLLWQKIMRKNKKIGLKAQIISFIPASGEPVEIMYVKLTNISKKPISFIPTAAIPIYGRSANNLHDHRHVTSLLQRIKKKRWGVIVKPTLVFNERGHQKNLTSYFVWGIDQKGNSPQYIFSTQEEFTGEDSDLEAPQAVIKNLIPKEKNIQGKEAFAGLKFKNYLLKPEETYGYIILMGIVKDENQINQIWKKFNTPQKIELSLKSTCEYWQEKSNLINVETADKNFNNWFKWVNIQPTLRRIFGCSFLPDFDYGKGGKGWRDLWQDSLLLVLTSPEEARPLLINNFWGVRIDGTNATIVGNRPHEFIADRNNINRVWMDHASWPLFIIYLYIQQTGDLKILLEKVPYFRDHLLCRAREIDSSLSQAEKNLLETKNKKIYYGTILEHLLVENLVQFFNVGEHNFIRLENADWNDGLDMAAQFGESVAFSSMYAQNLRLLSDLIKQLKIKNIVMLKELIILFDSLRKKSIDYANIKKKQEILNQYLQSTKYVVSGKKISLPKEKIIKDLEKKAQWLTSYIRKQAWLKEGFFNGYYNNDKERVEGKIQGRIQMTLTGQVFPIMSEIATLEQIKILWKNVKKYLQDKKLKGFHLNTDFKKEQLNLGRAFSFVYGDKENGAFFNHMAVMFAYALYKRGFVKEGFEVLNSIYQMAINTSVSKIYPNLPEYFNAQGQGMYCYLTGSASWFIFTYLTEVCGIKGEYGNLVIEPKLTKEQFKDKDTVSITTNFAKRPIKIRFINQKKKDFGRYILRRIIFNGRIIAENLPCRFSLSRQLFLSLANKKQNLIEIILD